MIGGEKVQLFGEYALDVARGCLLRAGQPVHLRRQSYEVLKYLVENRGHLISKDRLIEEVWQGRAVTDGSLMKCIEEVREALGTDARKYIRNERGRGYIFDLEIVENGRAISLTSEQLDVVSMVVEDDGEVESPLLPEPHRQSHPGKIGKRPAVLVLSVFVIAAAAAAAALIYAKYFVSRSSRIDSIAVLPFVNATADPNAAYVSDGLTESLIDELARLPGLKVIARSSSFTYRGQDVDVQEVGRALSVRGVVIGRVEQRGGNLFVSAELVDVQD